MRAWMSFARATLIAAPLAALLAAPAMALSALDPRIIHSFQVAGQLMVVSDFSCKEGLPGLSLSEVRDRFGALCVSLRRAGKNEFHPRGNTQLLSGDELTLQASYDDYLKLREFTGETRPPISVAHA